MGRPLRYVRNDSMHRSLRAGNVSSIPVGHLPNGKRWHDARVKDERIYEIRRRRLGELIETRFAGRQSAFAEKIDRSPNYVSRMLSRSKDPSKRKRIGEELARYIETACKIERLALDEPFDEIRDASVEQLGLDLTPTAKQIARDFDELPELAQVYVADVVSNVMTLMRKNPTLAKVMFYPPDPKAHARAMKRIVEYQSARTTHTPPDEE